MLCHQLGVGAMPLHAQRQRLDALQKKPRVVGRDAGSQVAKRDGAHAEDEGQRRERGRQVVAPAQPVVARVGLIVERMLSRGPVETAAVDHHPADAGAVAAEPFREGMDNNIGAEVQRLGQVRGRKCRVDNERDAVVMGDFGHRLKIDDLEGRVGDRLDKKRPCLLVDRLGKVLRIVGVDQLHLDAEGRQDVVELRVGAAVEVAGADDVVPRRSQIDD